MSCLLSSVSGRPFQSHLFHSRKQGGRLHPQKFRCAISTLDFPIRFLKNNEEVLAFASLHFRFGEKLRRKAVRFWLCNAKWSGWRIGRWQVEIQYAAARNDNGPFDHVPQLPDVTGPVVAL